MTRPSKPTGRQRRIVAALVWTTLLAAGTNGQAGRVRPLNLEQLTDRAAVIFSGRCADVQVEIDPALGIETTRVTFDVERGIKGETGSRLTLRIAGGNGEPGGRSVPGLPRFEPGQELVLFLYGTGPLGLSSPVGFGQGTFRIARDKLGRRVAVNDHGNAHLLRDLSAPAAARLDGIAPGWRERPLPDPDVLVALTRALLEVRP